MTGYNRAFEGLSQDRERKDLQQLFEQLSCEKEDGWL